jgi:hypothetical protein
MLALGAIRHVVDEVHVSLLGGVNAETGDGQDTFVKSAADLRSRAALLATRFRDAARDTFALMPKLERSGREYLRSKTHSGAFARTRSVLAEKPEKSTSPYWEKDPRPRSSQLKPAFC